MSYIFFWEERAFDAHDCAKQPMKRNTTAEDVNQRGSRSSDEAALTSKARAFRRKESTFCDTLFPLGVIPV
jgi:hypothetical protein